MSNIEISKHDVREIVLRLLYDGKPFTTADVIKSIAEEMGAEETSISDKWHSIRYELRIIRDEFLGTGEFCDSCGTPYEIPSYTRSKIKTDFSSMEINLYHPVTFDPDEYSPVKVERPASIQGITESFDHDANEVVDAIAKMAKIMSNEMREPVVLEPSNFANNPDGSLTISAEIMKRLRNVDYNQLVVCLDHFGVTIIAK